MEIIDKLRAYAKRLWRGDIINLGDIIPELDENINIAVSNIMNARNQGIDFPVEYIEQAVTNLNHAMEEDDAYLLADNLYFEWAEIFTVYSEWLEGTGGCYE